MNVPPGTALLIGQGLSVVAEVIPENGVLPDGFESDWGWSIGFNIVRRWGGQ